MNAGKQNPNTGGVGSSSMSEITTKKVSVTSADNQPVQKRNSGETFLEGEPKGSEAHPSGSNHGFHYGGN